MNANRSAQSHPGPNHNRQAKTVGIFLPREFVARWVDHVPWMQRHRDEYLSQRHAKHPARNQGLVRPPKRGRRRVQGMQGRAPSVATKHPKVSASSDEPRPLIADPASAAHCRRACQPKVQPLNRIPTLHPVTWDESSIPKTLAWTNETADTWVAENHINEYLSTQGTNSKTTQTHAYIHIHAYIHTCLHTHTHTHLHTQQQ
jgi:hypothetical protein